MYTMNEIYKNTLLSSAFMLFLSVFINGCTPTVAQRGNMIKDYQLSELVPTIHTQSDVLRIMGSPTTKAPFDSSTWYYIGQETEKHGILDPELTKERIIVAQFDQEGILQSVKDMSSGRVDVPIERSKTPTHGNDVTVIQQFLGNLGKFNPQSSDP